MCKKAFSIAALIFGIVALIVATIWHNRDKWSWPATWICGLTTSALGLFEQMFESLNTNAAGLGVILTLIFGLLSWFENRKRTKAILEAAENGTLHVEKDD